MYTLGSSILVLMVSFHRKDGATKRALQALDTHPRVDRVLLRGACPEEYFYKVECLPLRKTLFHKAYSSLPKEYIPVRFHCRDVCPQGSWCGTDPLDRVRWRTNLNLDALSGLMSAVHDIPKGSLFVWLENDVELYPERLPDDAPTPYSCWGRPGKYVGSGALCFVFRNDASLLELIRCLVAKHTIIPFDWLVVDCMGDTMRTYDASKHLGKVSTRVQ